MPKCEHGLRSTECYTCASPKHGAFAQDQRKPLSEEEIRDLWTAETKPVRYTSEMVNAFARAVERAHGIGGQDE